MIYGLYLSAQGAKTQSDRLDVVANNLANASTSAFKRDLALFQSHQPYDVAAGIDGPLPGNLNEMTGGVSLAGVATDFSDGPLNSTGGRYDIALVGPGFFSVTDGREKFLTRNGQLTVNEQGELVSQATGLAVVGVGDTRIVIPSDAQDVSIALDGSVFSVTAEGQADQIGRIELLQPESFDQLQKLGEGLYRSTGRLLPADENVRVLQGQLEGSGIRPVLETMDMIEASRAFEMNVNMIRIQDESLQRLLQAAARR